jgi:hypothetical protein
MTDADREAYDELTASSAQRPDAEFLHQHIVDAWAAQTAQPGDPPIRLAQALIGLYLHVEHGLTGRQVQHVHQIVANQRPQWPVFVLPADCGAMTAAEVLRAPAGAPRDAAIREWARQAWEPFSSQREPVATFLASCGIWPPGKSGKQG